LFRKLKEKAKEITQNIPVLYIAYKRKDVPVIAKIIIIAAIIYGLSPIDLIPDFIPVLGYFDDLIILPLLIYLSINQPRRRSQTFSLAGYGCSHKVFIFGFNTAETSETSFRSFRRELAPI
jgi:uncharacterized membrane protein YkvA (DUF1232 family)